jgi:hypothetical protein
MDAIALMMQNPVWPREPGIHPEGETDPEFQASESFLNATCLDPFFLPRSVW